MGSCKVTESECRITTNISRVFPLCRHLSKQFTHINSFPCRTRMWAFKSCTAWRRSQDKWSVVDLGLKPKSSEFETQGLSGWKALHCLSSQFAAGGLVRCFHACPFIIQVFKPFHQRNWNDGLVCMKISLKSHTVNTAFGKHISVPWALCSWYQRYPR